MSNGLVKIVSLTALIAGAVAAHADISFISGNGGGSQDAIITALAGSTTGGFATLTSTDFSNAQTADHAYILSGLASGWTSSLGDGSGAKWVGVDQSGWNNAYTSHSALYAMNFNLGQAASASTLNLRFTVDDMLGDSNNQGLFIDGKAIANSTSYTDWNNQIENKSFALGALSAGQHTLYFDVNNYGAGPSGIMFSGNIHTQAVPEPAPMAALGLGLIGLVRRKTRKS